MDGVEIDAKYPARKADAVDDDGILPLLIDIRDTADGLGAADALGLVGEIQRGEGVVGAGLEVEDFEKAGAVEGQRDLIEDDGVIGCLS